MGNEAVVFAASVISAIIALGLVAFRRHWIRKGLMAKECWIASVFRVPSSGVITDIGIRCVCSNGKAPVYNVGSVTIDTNGEWHIRT